MRSFANDLREATTIFGATLLGDSAISMPAEKRAASGLRQADSHRHQPPPRHRSRRLQPGEPVQQPEHARPRHPAICQPPYVTATNPLATATNTARPVTLNIQTAAPFVRVRVFTPFNQNTGLFVWRMGGRARRHDRPPACRRRGPQPRVATNELVSLDRGRQRGHGSVQRADAVRLLPGHPGPESRLDRRGPDGPVSLAAGAMVLRPGGQPVRPSTR